MGGYKIFKRVTRYPRTLVPRSLTTTHHDRQAAKRAESRARAVRRANRRAEFEARQLVVRERLRKERKN